MLSLERYFISRLVRVHMSKSLARLVDAIPSQYYNFLTGESTCDEICYGDCP